MLKPCGHFIICDVMDQTWYAVDDMKFSALRTSEEVIKTAFKECGFEIEQFETHNLGVYPEPAQCDAKSLYCIVGKKLKHEEAKI